MFIGFFPFVFLVLTAGCVMHGTRHALLLCVLSLALLLSWGLFHLSHHLDALSQLNW